MKIRPKLPYFLFLFIISIVGCAVLKIDVDVYKGPLSNSEDMQGKQLVAMVAGTKDLLVQLRNNLELERGSGVGSVTVFTGSSPQLVMASTATSSDAERKNEQDMKVV